MKKKTKTRDAGITTSAGQPKATCEEVKRDEFLGKLQLVQCAVAQRETVIQSKCFCFRDGMVIAYNDEIMCQVKSGIKKLKLHGAVEAQPLLDYLNKVPTATVSMEVAHGKLIVRWQDTTARSREKYSFNMESEVNLPVDQVEEPGEWKKLPDHFGEAVALVQECARDKHGTFCRTVICITPKGIQAYDGQQMVKYKMRTGVESDYILLRKEGIKHITSLGMVEFSESENWVHFRNAGGLTFSCRRWLEEYPLEDLAEFFTAKGDPITLPAGIDAAVDRVQVCTQQLADAERVKVIISAKEVTLVGLGITLKGEATHRLEGYTGKPYSFFITPSLLANISKKYKEAELTEGNIIVKGDGWTYVAGLVNPDDVEDEVTGLDDQEPAYSDDEEGTESEED